MLKLSLIALIFIYNVAHGQDRIPFKDALSRVEQKHHVKFFYKYEWIEDLTLPANYNDLPLDSFLKTAFQNTDLKYHLYQSRYIILLKDVSTDDSVKLNRNKTPDLFISDDNVYLIEGYVKDANSGEAIPGATILVEEEKTGISTNPFGFYSLALSSGKYTLRISAIGKSSEIKKIILLSNQLLNINLFEGVTELNEVEISGDASDKNISSIEMSLIKLDVKAIKSIPVFFGEPDIIKSITLLPGVKTVGDGAGGFNVRGGNVDQNLILLDDVPIFSTSHLFGFFSAFNADAVKDVNLFKAGIPAQYGGRISSVLEVKLKNGNLRKFEAKGGVGPITSKLFFEGPIAKEKSSVLVGARYAYPDWVLRKVPDLDIRRSSGMFYDLTGKVYYRINDNNNLSFTGYSSGDNFKLAGDTLYGWKTSNASFKWNSALSKKLFTTATVYISDYSYYVEGQHSPELFVAKFGNTTRGLKFDAVYLPNVDHKIEIGAMLNSYLFNSGEMRTDSESSINPTCLPKQKAYEPAIYMSDEYKVNTKVTFYGGVRLSGYSSVGSGSAFLYDEGKPKSINTIIDTVSFDKGEFIRTYHGLEPRFSVKVSLTEISSIKASYNRTIQYLHLISNTTAISPLDLWKSSDYHIKPETGHQIALGYFHNIAKNLIETSAEIYYKEIENMLEYKDGAKLFLNPAPESVVLPALGKAYGIETLVKKNSGKVTGWVGYTYSRTLRKVKGEMPAETINQGEFYPSNFDKPHDFSIVTNFKFTRRLSLSTNFIYNTGRPITYPDEVYIIDGYAFVQFSARNKARIPDYHRLDISITLDESLNQSKKWKGSWTLSFFNAYGRKNPYSVFFKPEYRGAQPQAYRLSVLGTVFPSLTYNFKIN